MTTMWQWCVILAAVGAFLWSIRARRGVDRSCYNPPQFVPFFGSLFSLSSNIERHYEWKTQLLHDTVAAGKEIYNWSLMATPPNYEMATPRMISHMLKDNPDNFLKGAFFLETMQEILGRGIFAVDGEEWRSQRKIASHMFSSRQLSDHMMSTFQQHSRIVMDRLDKLAEGEVIDFSALFLQFTLDSVAQVACGINIGGLTAGDNNQSAFVKAFDVVQLVVQSRWMAPPFVFRFKRAFGLGDEGDLNRAMVTINEFAYDVVRQRKANMDAFAASGDLLSLFLNDAKTRGEELSDVFLRDVILNFLLAGRDTTAAAMTYIFKCLSENPHAEAKVVEEILRVAGEEAEINESHLKGLRYLEAVFLETVRLYPPVVIEMKTSVNESTFPDGTVVPGGSRCFFSPWCLARLPSIWGEDAEEFKPERWLDEEGHVIQPSNYKYPHFNAGQRLCLGKQMAINESKVLAATILRKYSVKQVPGTDEGYKLTLILVLKNGLPVTLTRR